MSVIKVNVYGRSDVGQKRSNNQDNMLINKKHSLFAVADGMGGHSGGEVASEIAVESLDSSFQSQIKKQKNPLEALKQSILKANLKIFEHSQKEASLRGMGTTLTAVSIHEELLYIGQVGDSRCYLFQDESLFQLTEDHSHVYELLKAGVLTEANMHEYQKNIITRSVGYEKNVEVDTFTRLYAKGDRYLICSDGLTGMVSDQQIGQILLNFSPKEAVENLVDVANLQGGDDNITVIVFDIL